MLASFLAAALSVSAPPEAGALQFGAKPVAIAAWLGEPVATDTPDDFTWRDYKLGKGLMRVAYYKDRASRFTLLPDAPLPAKQAFAWCRAFVPGFDRGRVTVPNPTTKLIFGMMVIQGRPFETEIRLDMAGEKVHALGGEIHWLD
jgi:hypothetical protein